MKEDFEKSLCFGMEKKDLMVSWVHLRVSFSVHEEEILGK